jgi:hypothetical protein
LSVAAGGRVPDFDRRGLACLDHDLRQLPLALEALHVGLESTELVRHAGSLRRLSRSVHLDRYDCS